jgi:hypothetical protein
MSEKNDRDIADLVIPIVLFAVMGVIAIVILFMLFGCAQPHRFDPLRQQQLQQQQQECLNRGGNPKDCRP